MDYELAQKAISRALAGNWKEAIELNKKILKSIPDDTDTLNRLAKAYFELGCIKKAKEFSQKVLKIDPLNTIAIKSMDRWKSLRSVKELPARPSPVTDFIEEAGKTKLVSLLNIGDAKVLGGLDAGDEVQIFSHAHRVCITTIDKKYIGRLPDDLSARLRLLMKNGNTYQVFIKSLCPKSVKVFIKELQRSKKSTKIPSFPLEFFGESAPENNF